MPAFLVKKLTERYGNNKRAVYGTLNKIGAVRGNKETPKGAAMEAKHEAEKHSTRTEHNGKFRERDSGSNHGYDRKP